MTVISVDKDAQALTMNFTTEFAAPVERVWEMWENPRLLERWWGPPTYPATMVRHELVPGGSMRYYMTSPEGDKYFGWWRVLEVEAPHRLDFENGLAGDDGEPAADTPPMLMHVHLNGTDSGTRMVIDCSFPSVAVMEKLMDMGFPEGMSAALSQIDNLV